MDLYVGGLQKLMFWFYAHSPVGDRRPELLNEYDDKFWRHRDGREKGRCLCMLAAVTDAKQLKQSSASYVRTVIYSIP